jgi:hypothetical protein
MTTGTGCKPIPAEADKLYAYGDIQRIKNRQGISRYDS